MLHSGSWPLLRMTFSSSVEAFSWEISGMTWVESDNVFLVLCRMNELRFDLLPSLGATANDILLSSSLIEYFTWEKRTIFNEFWAVHYCWFKTYRTLLHDVITSSSLSSWLKSKSSRILSGKSMSDQTSQIQFAKYLKFQIILIYLQFLLLKCMSTPVFRVHSQHSSKRHLYEVPRKD